MCVRELLGRRVPVTGIRALAFNPLGNVIWLDLFCQYLLVWKMIDKQLKYHLVPVESSGSSVLLSPLQERVEKNYDSLPHLGSSTSSGSDIR